MVSIVSTATDLATGDASDPGEESLIILQSLICLMREKNLLTRVDVEQLCQKVSRRARGESKIPLPYCPDAARGASDMMDQLNGHIGQRYGGRRART